MTTLLQCPKTLPPELTTLIENFGKAWALCESRPRISTPILEDWSDLLANWSADVNLPIFVRKNSNNRGSVIHHTSGRVLIPCDNSPAHWVFIMASTGKCPSLVEIKSLFAKDEIPVAMIQKKVEKTIATYHRTLANEFNVNQYGWKLAHIESVGLNNRTSISELPIDRLLVHFQSLMSPANMFLIPLAWSGLAEIESVINAIAYSKLT